MERATFLLGCMLAATGCGGTGADNSTFNNASNNTNTTANNTTTNNTTANNTTTNNTTANNTTTNNSTANNTTANNTTAVPYELTGECRLHSRYRGSLVDAIAVEQSDLADYSRLTAALTDLDADGVFDHVALASYDAQGHQVSADEDEDGDGLFEKHFEWSYDSDGNLVRLLITKGDAVMYEVTQTFDAQGRLLLTEFDGRFEVFPTMLADGVVDLRIERTYNGDQLETLRVDEGADGSAEATETNMFDPNGNITRSERDGLFDLEEGYFRDYANGKPDFIRTFTRDANNQLVRFEQDGLGGFRASQMALRT